MKQAALHGAYTTFPQSHLLDSMAKDFRPKAARQAAAGSAKKVGNQGARKSSAPPAPAERQKVKPAEEGASPDGDGDEDEDASSEEEEDESALLREIKALGGNEEDLKLISKTKGKGKGKELRDEDEEVDVSVSKHTVKGAELGTDICLCSLHWAENSWRSCKDWTTNRLASLLLLLRPLN